MDVYVTGCAHADPNQFQHQLLFKQTKRVTLNSYDFESLDSERGYTVTVYVPAVDENANKLLKNTLSVAFVARSAIEKVVPIFENTVETAEIIISDIENAYEEKMKPAAEDLWSVFASHFLQN
jgi:hypothetical protein